MIRLNLRLFVLLMGVVVLTVSCNDKDKIDEDFIQQEHIIKGTVEKGPFVRGTTVEMRTMDKKLSLTGSSFSSTIEDNLGNFNFGTLKMNSPYAKLSANGYFFNEVSGDLSSGPIQLDAIVDLTEGQIVNVNLLTHLTTRRIVYLMTNENISFAEADKQAQIELLTAFGLQKYATKNVSQFSLADGDDAAGALIAISSLIQSDREEAQIVEFLAKLSTEFASTGTFSESTENEMQKTRNRLNNQLTIIRDNIIHRYQELGRNITVKDLAYYFDWDNDGIAGNELDGNATVTLDKNEITSSGDGGDFTVIVKSDKPYYLENPVKDDMQNEPPIVSPEVLNLYAENSAKPALKFTSSIKNNEITIHVAPSKSRKPFRDSLHVYNARGQVAATLYINQYGNSKADPESVKLSAQGISILDNIFTSLGAVLGQLQSLERNYAFRNSHHTSYSPFDSNIDNSWHTSYHAINYILNIKGLDKKQYNCYQDYLDAYLAIAYYSMSSYWGGVPFITEQAGEMFNISRMDENELLSALAKTVIEIMPYVKEKRNETFAGTERKFFISKDVIRGFGAYILMNQKNYQQAVDLLEQIIKTGHYRLTNLVGYADNDECILGFKNNDMVIPCLDFKDVLLSAAECHYHLGNQSSAREYINKICQAKGLLINTNNVLGNIAFLRKKLGSPYYLAFIRRNNLGNSELGLSDDNLYQLLFPIPQSELNSNPLMNQNPGY